MNLLRFFDSSLMQINTQEVYEVLLPLGLILIISKLFCIGCKKIGAPQVVGMLLTGLLLSVLKYIPGVGNLILNDTAMGGIKFIAKIGVILIMFSAGLGTDIKQIKATGVASIVITILGVVFPMAFGFGLAFIMNVGDGIYSHLFYGAILTATSVSVTVAALKELGKLDTKVGTAIVSAAILDDIIGVIVLSFVIGLSGNNAASDNPLANGICTLFGLDKAKNASAPWMVCVLTLLFFVCLFIVGFIVKKIFTYLDKHDAHHRRLPIFGISVCFIFAYCSEMFFGIADITGAFFAGLILATSDEKQYIDRRSEIISYMLFTPVFFANIGLSLEFTSIDLKFIGFGVLFIIVGILGKIIGCGIGAKVCKFKWKESLRVGLGMMCRAEVCLICAQKGIDAGLIGTEIMPFILALIIITSFVTPMLLKISYKGDMGDKEAIESAKAEAQASVESAAINENSADAIVSAAEESDSDK